MRSSKSYSQLVQLDTFEERFEYLSLQGVVGDATFGFDRWANQEFYRSTEWRRARRDAIVRDLGMDMGLEDHPIDRPYVHHINPLTLDDIDSGSPSLIRLDNLITVSHNTHNAIHYGDASLLPTPWVERRPGDTKSW